MDVLSVSNFPALPLAEPGGISSSKQKQKAGKKQVANYMAVYKLHVYKPR
jgi:hypothetical protein